MKQHIYAVSVDREGSIDVIFASAQREKHLNHPLWVVFKSWGCLRVYVKASSKEVAKKRGTEILKSVVALLDEVEIIGSW